MELLLSQLQSVAKFSSEEEELVASCFKLKKLEKNEILVNVGEICHYLYFVRTGCIRTFYYRSNGTESTRCLAFPGNFATDMQSFCRAVPTNECVQALMPSELYIISKANFDMLLREVPAWHQIYTTYLEILCFDYLKRIESFINRDSKERYLLLLEQNPIVVQKLSNKIVASYLGIKQESLSRLKRSLSVLS